MAYRDKNSISLMASMVALSIELPFVTLILFFELAGLRWSLILFQGRSVMGQRLSSVFFVLRLPVKSYASRETIRV